MENILQKLIKLQEFGFGLPAKLHRMIPAHSFSPSLFKLKKGILSPLTK